jgi:hypothetical protein
MMLEKMLFFVELAAGIVIGFTIWSYVSPSLSGVAPVPNA